MGGAVELPTFAPAAAAAAAAAVAAGAARSPSVGAPVACASSARQPLHLHYIAAVEEAAEPRGAATKADGRYWADSAVGIGDSEEVASPIRNSCLH